MHSEQFFAEVQAELDARRDPLDRADLVAWLEQNPESLDEFANLRVVHYRLAEAETAAAASLDHFPQAHPVPQAPRASQASSSNWPVWVSLAAAAALLIFISMPPKQPSQQQSADVDASLETEDAPPLAMVISVKHSTSEKQTMITPTRSVQSSGASILSLSTTTRSVVVHSHP
ncbi:MAG: hypothetical protein HQ519_04855 [Planctomycetes bacterium]|nr:hypothetical protein [Planctomycetota bacterium]